MQKKSTWLVINSLYFHGCLKLGLLCPIIEHLWELGMTLLWRHGRRPLQPTHKQMSGKWERGERFMCVKSFFSGNIQQAYHPRVEFHGTPKTTQASGMIPALIPEKVMLLTWNWTALMMSQQILDPFFAVLGNGRKNCPNLRHWQIIKNKGKTPEAKAFPWAQVIRTIRRFWLAKKETLLELVVTYHFPWHTIFGSMLIMY